MNRPAWTPVFWQSLRLMASCALATGAAKLFKLPDDYWALITAIIVTQPAFDATLKAGRIRITGTLIGAVAGFAVIAAVQFGAPLDVMFWIALLPLTVLTAIRPELRLGGITLVVMVLIPGAASWQRPLDRVLEILTGTIASVIVSALILPRPAAPETGAGHAE